MPYDFLSMHVPCCEEDLEIIHMNRWRATGKIRYKQVGQTSENTEKMCTEYSPHRKLLPLSSSPEPLISAVSQCWAWKAPLEVIQPSLLLRGDHLQSRVRSTAEFSKLPGWRNCNLSQQPLPALNTPLSGVFIAAIMMWYSQAAKRPLLILELLWSQAIKPYFTTISTGSSL